MEKCTHQLSPFQLRNLAEVHNLLQCHLCQDFERMAIYHRVRQKMSDKRRRNYSWQHGFRDINKCKYLLLYGSIKALFLCLGSHAPSYLLFTADIEVEYELISWHWNVPLTMSKHNHLSADPSPSVSAVTQSIVRWSDWEPGMIR